MAKGIFDDAKVTVTCPGCGHETEKTISWLKANDKMVCEGCGNPVSIENNEALRESLKGVDKSLAEFRRKLSRFNKRK